MHTTRRQILIGGSAILFTPFIARHALAKEPEVTLRLHHYLPAVSNGHKHMLMPWVEKIAAQSEGRIKIEIFPAMQLGGTPPQLYDQARDGVVDIVWTMPGSTPGRFPTTEVMELPFIASDRGVVNAVAAQEFADKHLAGEVSDIKLLSYWAHDGGHIHANRKVTTMEDLAGLKLRNPTRLAGEALKAMGAIPVGMPVSQVAESLAQGVIDGAVVPWEIVPAAKIHELVKYHTEIVERPAFYTTSFFLAMNKARYEGLPDALRAVIDANSGAAFARAAGEMWDQQAVRVKALVLEKGNTITVLSADEKARWIETCRSVETEWAKALSAKGLDGEKLASDARDLVARNSN